MPATSDARCRVFPELGAHALIRRGARAAGLLLLTFAIGCARPRTPDASLPPPTGTETPADSPSAPSPSWVAWGDAAFARARAESRHVLVMITRRLARRDRDAWAAIESDPQRLAAWGARAVLVRADVDEAPELADFAELAATTLSQQRVFPMALLLTPEALPVDVVADDASVERIDEMLARHTPLPAVRTTDSASLEAIRRAQQSSPGAVAAERIAARVQTVSGFRDASLASALLLVEAHEVQHSAPAGQAAGRVLDAWRHRAVAGSDLDDVAWRLWLHARLAPSPVGPDADAAAEMVAAMEAALADESGLLRAGVRHEGGETIVDPRLFTGANGRAVAALAEAGVRFSRPADVERAQRMAEALLARFGPANSLRRGSEGERSFGPARLDDYAGLGLGLLALHEATNERRWLAQAEAVADAAVAALWDASSGGFFLHGQPIGPLPVRMKSAYDGPRPSGNAQMALLLDALGRRTGRSQLRDLARRTVEAFAADLQQARSGVDGLMAASVRIRPASAAPPATSAPRAPAPARVTRGSVTVEARLEREVLRRGERAHLQVRVSTASGWAVTPHRPADRSGVPLSVTLLEPDLGAGAAVFPATTAGGHDVLVPLRVPADAPPGPRAVRVVVRFEACPTGRRCEPPERVVLEAPLTVAR